MSDLSIRPAQLSDADVVFRLLKDFVLSYRPDRSAFDKNFPRLLESGHYEFLVAEVRGEVVGYALVVQIMTLYANGPIAEIQELMVDPNQRGMGIGRDLVQTIVEHAQAAGAVEVTVPTRRAGEFYRKLGFVETASYFNLELGE